VLRHVHIAVGLLADVAGVMVPDVELATAVTAKALLLVPRVGIARQWIVPPLAEDPYRPSRGIKAASIIGVPELLYSQCY
jgi:hypothetical protein